MNVVFNRPLVSGKELTYLQQVLADRHLSGDGIFTKKCHDWLEKNQSCPKALLTTSCTHALEMAALLTEIGPGDEVIMPSYTFVSTANAFVLRGARIKFVDIRPDTMNIDEKLIEHAITSRTKAIVPVHYAGVGCEMDAILDLARQYHLSVIEDAAQGVLSRYRGRSLGTMGDLGCYSFHESKNYTSGEGGALSINNAGLCERAEILREKGTNRSQFFRGQVDKYTWLDLGSSYLPSELNAAFLYAQLEQAEQIFTNRMRAWEHYFSAFADLEERGLVERPHIPEHCEHNAHVFFLKVKDLELRTALINDLKKNGVMTVFHYIPLHSSPAGKRFGDFVGRDDHTTKESERLLRLPLFYGIRDEELDYVIESIHAFFLSGFGHA